MFSSFLHPPFFLTGTLVLTEKHLYLISQVGSVYEPVVSLPEELAIGEFLLNSELKMVHVS